MDGQLRVEVRVELKDANGCSLDSWFGSTGLMSPEWARAGFARLRQGFPHGPSQFELLDEYEFPDDAA